MLSSTPTTSGWPSGTNAATSRPSKILEPCRPDHAPRDRNRWNRLKPLSDAPSTARRAAQTVLVVQTQQRPCRQCHRIQPGRLREQHRERRQPGLYRPGVPGLRNLRHDRFPHATNTRETSFLPTESPDLRTSSRLWGHYRAAWETAKVQVSTWIRYSIPHVSWDVRSYMKGGGTNAWSLFDRLTRTRAGGG